MIILRKIKETRPLLDDCTEVLEQCIHNYLIVQDEKY